MKKLKDSSEIQEAARLFKDILTPAPGKKKEPEATGAKPVQAYEAPAAHEPQAVEKPRAISAQAVSEQEAPTGAMELVPPEARPMTETLVTPVTDEIGSTVAGEPVPVELRGQPEEATTAGYRADRLESVLEVMCKRGGLNGAVIADDDGLPLAVFQSPVQDDIVAAFTSIAGNTIEKAGKMLNQPGANNLSIDINYEDKVVLRRFDLRGRSYYIMAICPQGVDERSEVELSIEQIRTILI